MAKVVSRKLIVVGFRLARKAQTQIDKHDMFPGAWKRVQHCTERAAKPRDQAIGKNRKEAQQRDNGNKA
ncbi:hypothetical protein PPGU19_096450 (plasmid) [Paraburkholderia sp. PGU19]|nr:hypothetical protein PPGU19_096450 [Paraburkholderia sp. PGU19]